jgi:hypothetical protein
MCEQFFVLAGGDDPGEKLSHSGLLIASHSSGGCSPAAFLLEISGRFSGNDSDCIAFVVNFGAPLVTCAH